ncbi:MAG: HAMP domain-containing histidine kinase [Lachnospiraceae bacterium]|jgi:Signal transduction histidine kinase|nr:HAMP domain-containing histidine kinase [Lachnospiraceae bacterium]
MVYGLVGILVVIIAMLSIKIYLMERSAEEIMEAFGDRLESDTNILIDISSRNRKMRKLAARINAELRLLRKERRCYQQGNQELKDSVTNISHDLRTPLTAICGYLNLLKHEEKSAAVETYLVQIQSGVDVLRGLTEELFRYSIVTSSYELKREKINVVSVLEESLLSFYASMQEKGIQPVISMPEEPVWRMLDISALNRIFSNVIGNALKYSDGDLTVELKENGTIIFSNTAKTLNAVIVGRLFDRFCTVGTSYYATGLGLSIAKILTERMGGHIRAEYRDEMLFITVQFCISLL